MSCPRPSTAGCHLLQADSPVQDLEVVIQALADPSIAVNRRKLPGFVTTLIAVNRRKLPGFVTVD